MSPTIILVRPQLAENVGTTARAMLNCGLKELRVVAPREDICSTIALRASAGADEVLERALIFETVAAAVADQEYILATTVRDRYMEKPVYTPEDAVMQLAPNLKSALLFGAERTGLTNGEIAYAHGVITIPTNPDFNSLNLAQAVLLIGYLWSRKQQEVPQKVGPLPAPANDLNTLLDELEKNLDDRGYFRVPAKREGMILNMRAMFLRCGLTTQEVRTLRGIFRAFWE